MNYGFIRTAAIAGVSTAGGIVYQLLSPSLFKQKELTIPKAKLVSVTSFKEEPSRKCFIFVTDKATGGKENPRITKILKKSEGIEEFLKDIGSTAHETFKRNVRSACKGNKSKIHKTRGSINIYVYQQNDGRWSYNRKIQRNWEVEGIKFEPLER
ncbi:hypothetical protein MHF_1139 [Mycoplasma haemofelis Ohio2]|uniref:Uncharacterized protein n=1 Tax=Mycoplasma haemofelis (strain Ohio2) TaxID=859194 RepID=F6FJM7_MYCHI|nr:hypothetical protein MHF_1139 [Mycoplasma haemofelis Ohio2]